MRRVASRGVSGLSAVVALLAGLLHAWSFATPWDGQPVWVLQLLSLALLIWRVDAARTPARAGVLAWLFSLAWLAGGTWWMFVSMHVYGGLPAPAAALAVAALSGALAIYYAAMALAYRALRPAGEIPRAVLFAALWLLAELMRARWFTGFPWVAAGYAHVDGPLAGFAPLVGVYGISALAALIAGLLVGQIAAARPREAHPSGYSRRQPRAWHRATSGVLALSVLLAGWWLVPAASTPGPGVAVTLLQGNIPQDEKFLPGSGIPGALAWYGEQLRSSADGLVVAPETALPLLPQQLPPGYLDSVAEHFQASHGSRAALVGIPLGGRSEGYTNSVIGLKTGAEPVYVYSKYHLVPFGEFIPPLFRWFTEMMNIPLGDFNRGTDRPPSFEWAGQRFAPNICYEDLFGEELAARFAEPAQAPTIFVNLSNIGWFGDTVAIDQHLQKIGRASCRERVLRLV